MVAYGQEQPLAPSSSVRIRSEEEMTTAQHKNVHDRRCIKWCGCCSAVGIILAVVLIVLVFTVFRIKNPDIMINGLTITKIKINRTSPLTLDPSVNISMIAHVSVKNPNIAPLKYKNSTTVLSYRGNMVGDLQIPAGRSKAKHTQKMNLTGVIITAKLNSDSNLANDISTGLLDMGTYTRLGGRVKILKIIKRHITLTVNCTMTLNLTSFSVQDQKCKRKVSM